MILSLFPGVGLLDMAFEAEGFTVVRGPDLLWGGDVRRFKGPRGIDGIIGGPPCQDFSSARRTAPVLDGYGAEMLDEFARIVSESFPWWWMLENVDAVPDVRIEGYSWQRIDVDQGWYSRVRRLRHIQFGSRLWHSLDIPHGRVMDGAEPAALACDGRTFDELKRLQGLPEGYDLPGFTVEEKKRAVGNGVPLVMGRVLARAVRRTLELPLSTDELIPGAVMIRRCGCGCGREVRGLAEYDGPTCRKRAQRRRDRTWATNVTDQAAAV